MVRCRMDRVAGIAFLKRTVPLLTATLLLLQVVVISGSPAQDANAQGFNLPTNPIGSSGYAVQIEYRDITYYHTLPGDPVVSDDHQISYRSNATVLQPFLDELRGNGTGHYKETYDDNCGTASYNLLLEGEASMEVRIWGDRSKVQVSIRGENLTHVESDTDCKHYGLTTYNQYGYVEAGCTFSNVDLENGGSFKSDGYLDYVDEDEHAEHGCLMTIFPLNQSIDVKVDDSEIHLKFNLDQTGVEEKPRAKVTVTLTMGGSPAKNKSVMIKVCTLPGTTTTDGHTGHDQRIAGWEKTWSEPCDQGERPFAVLADSSGKKGNILLERTDNNGQIILDYTPPLSKFKGKYPEYHYIAGKDEITATAVHGAPTLQDKATVITKVPGLIRMPGSVDDASCPSQSSGNHSFATQGDSKHGCIFYGTSESNRVLQNIGDEFMRRQQECANNPGSGACQISYGGTLHNVTIKGVPQKMRINAMSLPWGGITDNVKSIKWYPPHLSHNDGRQVDLSFGIFKLAKATKNTLCNNLGTNCRNYDIDRIMLLRDVVEKSPNFYRFPSNEGGDLQKTFADPAPHIHIFFRR